MYTILKKEFYQDRQKTPRYIKKFQKHFRQIFVAERLQLDNNVKCDKKHRAKKEISEIIHKYSDYRPFTFCYHHIFR